MSDAIDLGGLQPSAFGPLLPLIEDEDVVEIMVAGPHQVTVQRRTGERERADVTFSDAPALDRVIDAVTAPLLSGEDRPAVRKGQLSSSLRLTAIMRPASVGGSTLNITKLAAKLLSREELLEAGMVSPFALEFLRACVLSGMNVLITGGARSGKTTLLNELASFIPEDERIVTIEHGLSLRLAQPDVVRLTVGDDVSPRDLLSAVRGLSADRILIDELRAEEAYDFIQGMNNEIGGAIATLHGPDVEESLHRLENKMQMGEPHAQIKFLRDAIASGLHMIVQLRREWWGVRHIAQITEVRPRPGEGGYELVNIFEFMPESETKEGKLIGALKPTGLRPKYYHMFDEVGIVLPPTTFSVPPRPE